MRVPYDSLDMLLIQCRYYKAFAAYAGCNLGLATSAAALCAFIAPAAAGSGIPEVKAYLNGVDAYSILAPSTLFVKVNGIGIVNQYLRRFISPVIYYLFVILIYSFTLSAYLITYKTILGQQGNLRCFV